MSSNHHFEDIVRFILPADLLDYFEITSANTDSNRLNVYLVERNIIPEQYSKDQLLSKGFYPESSIQDFPIRDKALFLHVKRRRWTVKGTKKIVSRNWTLTAQGTRFTNEFGAFLKEFNRYSAD
nr:hypothetical protein [Pseudodesulfovibrio sp.]